MEFLNWFFNDHYIISTILAPSWSIVWGIFMNSAMRVLGSSLVVVVIVFIKLIGK